LKNLGKTGAVGILVLTEVENDKLAPSEQMRSDPSISHWGCVRALAWTFAGRAKFASLLCGEGKLELTELSSSALLRGGLAEPQLRASNEGLLIP